MHSRPARCLAAYFSREGANYVNGKIVSLSTGNTQAAAEMIRSMLACDTFRIRTVNGYPMEYEPATRVAQEELRKGARPELLTGVTDMPEYDTVLLGYPNWWGTMPMAVYTFLTQYDFSGKTILPFCTHEGSGLGRSEAEIKRLCPKADVLKGLAIRGGAIGGAKPEIEKWLKNNGLM
jgi:flavodoxin